MGQKNSYDAVVIGAGVFGAWTALCLRRAGKRVALVDAYGPGNARASSGGESRLIRMAYGAVELYTRWSMRSLSAWKEFFARTGKPLFHQTGILWIANAKDAQAEASRETLERVGVRHEILNRSELEARFPQIGFGEASWGIFEPESGVLLARRAVAAVVEGAIAEGVGYFQEFVSAPAGDGKIASVCQGLPPAEKFTRPNLFFRAGRGLEKFFRICCVIGFSSHAICKFIFSGVPAGDKRFAPPAMPGWLFQADLTYGVPDLESRGFKIALEVRMGQRSIPDTDSRVPAAERNFGDARGILLKDFRRWRRRL